MFRRQFSIATATPQYRLVSTMATTATLSGQRHRSPHGSDNAPSTPSRAQSSPPPSEQQASNPRPSTSKCYFPNFDLYVWDNQKPRAIGDLEENPKQEEHPSVEVETGSLIRVNYSRLNFMVYINRFPIKRIHVPKQTVSRSSSGGAGEAEFQRIILQGGTNGPSSASHVKAVETFVKTNSVLGADQVGHFELLSPNEIPYCSSSQSARSVLRLRIEHVAQVLHCLYGGSVFPLPSGGHHAPSLGRDCPHHQQLVDPFYSINVSYGKQKKQNTTEAQEEEGGKVLTFYGGPIWKESLMQCDYWGTPEWDESGTSSSSKYKIPVEAWNKNLDLNYGPLIISDPNQVLALKQFLRDSLIDSFSFPNSTAALDEDDENGDWN